MTRGVAVRCKFLNRDLLGPPNKLELNQAYSALRRLRIQLRPWLQIKISAKQMNLVEVYGRERMNSISMTNESILGVKCVELCLVKDISNHQSVPYQDLAPV